MKQPDDGIGSMPTLPGLPLGPAEHPTYTDADGANGDVSVDELVSRLTELRRLPPRRIGEVAGGGMARIFAVHEPLIGRRSAMKVLRQELVDVPRAFAWFIREAHVTGQLDHPNIVPVHDLGLQADGSVYFTMKLVEGRTFQQLVDALPSRPLERAELLELLGVLVKVCDAVAFAHSRGVVHADIKPANVMVGGFGQVYLMDWGIARLLGGDDGRVAEDGRVAVDGRIAENGRGVEGPAGAPDGPGPGEGARAVRSWIRQPVTQGTGSPGFFAPEQAAGAELDERTDVFGVGALLYYLLTRRPPFLARTVPASFALAIDGVLPPVEELAPGGRVPRTLSAIIARAMAKRPEDRHPTVAALQAEIQSFLWNGGDFPTVTFRQGDHVIREGDRADAAYVIVEGRCDVYTEVSGRRVSLAQLAHGDVFGETAIFTGSARTANVVALEETSVVRIPNDVFEQELEGMKPWMSAFARAVAQRFRSQLESSRAAAVRAPSHVADLVLLHVERMAGAGSSPVALSGLVECLNARYGLGAVEVRRVLAGCPEVDIDPYADRVAVKDPAALRARLTLV